MIEAGSNVDFEATREKAASPKEMENVRMEKRTYLIGHSGVGD